MYIKCGRSNVSDIEPRLVVTHARPRTRRTHGLFRGRSLFRAHRPERRVMNYRENDKWTPGRVRKTPNDIVVRKMINNTIKMIFRTTAPDPLSSSSSSCRYSVIMSVLRGRNRIIVFDGSPTFHRSRVCTVLSKDNFKTLTEINS